MPEAFCPAMRAGWTAPSERTSRGLATERARGRAQADHAETGNGSKTGGRPGPCGPCAIVAQRRATDAAPAAGCGVTGPALNGASLLRLWRQATARRCRHGLATAALALGAGAAAQVGDFDGDGTADVLLRDDAGAWRYHPFEGFAVAAEGASPIQLTEKMEWEWGASGDFDGDGRDDVLLRRNDGRWAFYPLDGREVVEAGRGWANLTRNLDWRVVGVADFNGDGRDDLLLRHTAGGWSYYAMNGRRQIPAASGPVDLPRSLEWRLAGVGDFDGDGRVDVLLRHAEGGWRVHPMDGGHPAADPRDVPELTPQTAWQVAGTGDFDGDGRDDVLLRFSRGLWRYQTLAADGATGGGTVGGWLPRSREWRLAGIGDLDGDGVDDVLLRHRDGGWRALAVAARGDRLQPAAGLTEDPAWRVARPPVHMPDAALHSAVSAALGNGAGTWITDRGLSQLTELVVEADGVANLTGLGAATRLRTLRLARNDVEDLAPLAGLASLQRLELHDNDIADVLPLAGLATLQVLRLSNNRIANIAPLALLGELGFLGVAKNDIADVSGLARLEKLHTLWLDENRIGDIGPLTGLRNLKTLHLHANRLEAVDPLAGLTGLERLLLGANQIRDVSPLAGLTRLSALDLHSNRISDIASLRGLVALESLFLGRNQVSDLSALTAMTGLEMLGLAENRISDLSPLAALARLAMLDLDHNEVVDVSALATLGNLEMLDLDHNEVVDTLGNLEMLDLDHNEVVDVSALATLGNLEMLDLGHNRIRDLSPLAALTRLAMLDLDHNEVVDVSALATLGNLEMLDLSYNRIRDLSPLAGLDVAAGGSVDVRGNPLSDESLAIVVPGLTSRGVVVESGVGARFKRVRNDVAVIHVEQDIATAELDWETIGWTFYSHFDDVFDFLIVLSNLESVYDNELYNYLGAYRRVSNDVRGIGRPPQYGRDFGSAGKLKGIVHLADNHSSLDALLHELMHCWTNWIVPTAHAGHWGFSSAGGHHGGFDIADRVNLGAGRYTAGSFRTGGVALTGTMSGNVAPYSPIELYAAGYLPPEEVPDLWVAEDGEWVLEADGSHVRTADGQRIFAASNVRTYAIEDLVAIHGERIPASGEAQWHFRLGFILLADDDHPATDEQLDRVSEYAEWFSLRRDDGRDELYNFYEATGGRGSVTSDGLAGFAYPEAVAPTSLPPSFGATPDAVAQGVDR